MKGITGFLSPNKPNTLQYIYNSYNNKFPDDKINYRDNEIVILFDGCLLNLTELKLTYNSTDFITLIKCMWEKYDKDVICYLKGSFVLVICDIKNNRLLITNDRLSKRPLYYYLGEVTAFSSRFYDLVALLKERKTPLTPDDLGIAMMLQKGFLWGNCTYIKEILILRQYESILVYDGKTELMKTTDVTFGSCQDTEQIALQRFNTLFVEAVKLQFRKNEESGYTQITTLSGGMDSRSVLLAAKKVGFTNITCLTYAQSRSNDFEISTSIASDNNLDIFFYPLDTANFLTDPWPRSDLNEGMHSYFGSTGAYTVFHNICDNNRGIIHCGLLGGEQLGDQYPVPYLRLKANVFEHCKLELCDDSLVNRYEDQISSFKSEDEVEVFMHLRGCQNLFRMAQDRFEIFSPFMDEDVFEYLFSLPISMKYGRLFYCKWMSQFYPNTYKTTFFNARLPKSEFDLRFKVLKRKFFYRLNNSLHRKSKMDMNPIAYWIANNNGLDEQIERIFYQELSRMESHPVLSTERIVSSVRFANRLNAISTMISLNNVYCSNGFN